MFSLLVFHLRALYVLADTLIQMNKINIHNDILLTTYLVLCRFRLFR